MTPTQALAAKGIQIDLADEWVGGNWTRRADGYVHRWTPRGYEYLHRVIMGCTKGDGVQVDHLNHDPSDNRRANLRRASRAVNQQNRKGAASHSKTGVRGVVITRHGTYKAQYVKDGKHHNLGTFHTLAEAQQMVEASR